MTSKCHQNKHFISSVYRISPHIVSHTHTLCECQMSTLPHNLLLFFSSFSFSFFSSLSLRLSFAHSIRMVSIFVDKFITKLLTIDTGFWSKFQRIISVNGFQFKIKRERSIKNSLYRFDLWPAVNIIQNGYELLRCCCRRHCEYESPDYLFRKVRGLMCVLCTTGSSNKRDLTQNFICKNYSFLGNVHIHQSLNTIHIVLYAYQNDNINFYR